MSTRIYNQLRHSQVIDQSRFAIHNPMLYTESKTYHPFYNQFFRTNPNNRLYEETSLPGKSAIKEILRS